ncbi:MAG: hypothetical protein UX26_C0019G0004 [Parcubacteria group bacterium GW2011_GWC1_45_9]|uniref:Uncharacterized protein n=1 Tax=Candidatus Woesebacteria bacterium GW2011_GWB1_39_12 TaxID=1618574 RepID=A0A0G0Q7L6_9BACT|nr:MAG: hypothetical protein UT24_C0045G0004 [Candidatus Woesebacteria bacterium GW2011_GWB1_39_12]KKU16652.1 MAG: hypothetical protein UX26_C0019G0004 [Parcubacteria group bacterium GW2011_GWC1_45_9]
MSRKKLGFESLLDSTIQPIVSVAMSSGCDNLPGPEPCDCYDCDEVNCEECDSDPDPS